MINVSSNRLCISSIFRNHFGSAFHQFGLNEPLVKKLGGLHNAVLRPMTTKSSCTTSTNTSTTLTTSQPTTFTISPISSRNPDPTTAKSHHINSPPTRFHNPWPSFRHATLREILRARFNIQPKHNHIPVPIGPDPSTRSSDLVRIQTPTWGSDSSSSLRATWLGHAGWLVELPVSTRTDDSNSSGQPAPKPTRGVRILFDAVFSERTSPVSFAGPKRYSPTPCAVEELPAVDFVCISHDHYDHLDVRTVKAVYGRWKGLGVRFVVPLGLKGWFVKYVGCGTEEVVELDWWEGVVFRVIGEEVGTVDVRWTCLPAQHGSGRAIWSMDSNLWASWAVEEVLSGSVVDGEKAEVGEKVVTGKKLWFAGDTAYQAEGTPSPCPVFEQIGKEFGSFDLALVPIGLYSPPSIGGAVHVTPEQSLTVHQEVKSKLSLGMHYGTVRGGLSQFFEDVREPPRRWRQAAEKVNLWAGGGVEGDGKPVDVTKGGVGLCHIGETVSV